MRYTHAYHTPASRAWRRSRTCTHLSQQRVRCVGGLRAASAVSAAVARRVQRKQWSRRVRAADVTTLLHGINAGYPVFATIPDARPCTPLPAHSVGSLSRVLRMLQLSSSSAATPPQRSWKLLHSRSIDCRHAARQRCRRRGRSRRPRLCGALSSSHGTEEHLEAALPALPAYASVASRFVLAGSRCVWVVSEAEAWAIRFRAGM